jgi:NAD(P)-dependent dehydrogenase (short-subunit alcohol dehydrogenase family)
MDMRFDNRVAIVTGSGSSPGLGRSYAKYLAARGAKVVVNDVSSDIGEDGLKGAERVAKEINDEGGIAIADLHSCAESDSAAAIVATALDAWGQVDILINNAGIIITGFFDEFSDDDVHRVVNVHLLGHIWMTRAVWGPMKERGYGRILNTSSGVMLGIAQQSVYSAAKGGVFALTRCLAIEGEPHGILVNSLAPSAGSAGAKKLAEDDDPWMNEVFVPNYSPDLVAPLATYLVHEDCSLTAQWLSSSGGDMAAGFFSKTKGIHDREISIEGVRDRISSITDRDGSVETPDPIEANKKSSFKPRAYRPGGTA